MRRAAACSSRAVAAGGVRTARRSGAKRQTARQRRLVAAKEATSRGSSRPSETTSASTCTKGIPMNLPLMWQWLVAGSGGTGGPGGSNRRSPAAHLVGQVDKSCAAGLGLRIWLCARGWQPAGGLLRHICVFRALALPSSPAQQPSSCTLACVPSGTGPGARWLRKGVLPVCWCSAFEGN